MSSEALWTAPYDARFPNANQTRACWQHYKDFFKCKEVKGDGFEACNYFKNVYERLCDSELITKYDEWREAGIFPGVKK